ncbi:hypothetical protein GCM10009530_19090 [Microbispora corallina]|uniref:Uncharacterized protein n=1 Tax=Microbispora corallina TaxID=83302 RepID=A0ABQ4FUI9_9ACTN|nr:hypothetical protein MPTA5024_28995 [Microbispora sp. ATCC PTA-5024]GIH38432.1 hypothetical protein Mco01_14320 [Microbispora corallina]
MVDTVAGIQEFASAVRGHIDLSVRVVGGAPPRVQVRNRFSDTLSETVTCSDEGAFVTSWGYRLGTVESVQDAAARLAYLMAALPA